MPKPSNIHLVFRLHPKRTAVYWLMKVFSFRYKIALAVIQKQGPGS